VVAALLYSQALYPFGQRGVQFLSGEACLERTLRATVEVRKGARVLWIARYVDEVYS
jgi:hypothetical protein